MSLEMEKAMGMSRVVREEFLAGGTRTYRDSIDETDQLFDKQSDTGFGYSAVSVRRLSNAKVWIDNQVICVYDDEHGVHEDLSLYFRPVDLERIAKTPLTHLGGELVLFPHLYPQNYYHWLIDTLPCFGVLEMAGIELESVERFHIHRMVSSFQLRHLEQLGIDPSKINSWGTEIQHFTVDELIVPFFRLDKGWPNPWAVDYLKDKFLPAAASNADSNDEDCGKGKRIYVARGNARRQITNEAELIERLSNEGYTIVEPHKMTVEEQAIQFSRADHVLGSHGAGLVNLAFCQPDTKVMEFAGHYVTVHFRMVAGLGNLKYRSIAAGLDSSGNRLPTSDAADIRGLEFMADIDHIVAEANAYFASE